MDVESEVIKSINDELNERAGSKESGHSDDNELILEDGIELTQEIGRISLEFADADAEKYSAYPSSYYTFSAKERLLLIFTENFRRQFKYTHPERKPLVLAIPNECGIQKFVSTTVRPTSFLFYEFIDCWDGPARFVSDFIAYEPLENPFEIPPRLVSPDTLLTLRSGNAFEMATLLCSLLIANRYGAMVVSGYASEVVTSCNQNRECCPNIPIRASKQTTNEASSSKANGMDKNKYALIDPVDLRSKFLLEVEARKLKQANDQRREEMERQLEELRILEKLPEDEHIGSRRHAWVVILSNVEWASKKSAGPEHECDETQVTRPFFIEPTTGVHFSTDDPNYYVVDSVWNEANYYVNLQDPGENNLKNLKWNFEDRKNWQTLLNEDSVVDFVKRSETPVELKSANISFCARYLDMPISWVKQFSVSNADYDERYPNGCKKIYYKRVLLELFAPYLNDNGVIKRLTLYKNLDHTDEITCWQWYCNREDSLESVEKDFETNQIIENYANGRPDSLRRFTRSMERDGEKMFEYYENSRLDGLILLEVAPNYVREHFEHRQDRFLVYREFVTDAKGNKDLLKIVEKFRRNEKIPFHENILKRTFDIAENKIILQFHYGYNDITPTIRVYTCPPKPNYGCEIPFSEDDNPVDMTNKYERNVPKLKRYYTLLEQLRNQEECIKSFESRLLHIESTMVEHQNNAQHPVLTTSIYDPLRNTISRNRRLAENDRIERQQTLAMTSAPDILAPYLVHFTTKPNEIESLQIYEKCLNDIQIDYTERLALLRQQYEDVSKEIENLKRYLDLYEDKIDEKEYDDYVKHGLELDVSQRVFKQRIVDIEEEYKRKYNDAKEQLKHDSRLTVDVIVCLDEKLTQ
ncbi:coiled-coil domain-containing protein lobo [Contarinia nasturtii]|uniref:coiled-coil domain-containing protein lobo n=1 Tax=Contarinia nasturtii TaxID=265458 RepID=UPI0012D399BE|nr:coiled-coil domain-containing protein lobo [Contarinia nasturtii]